MKYQIFLASILIGAAPLDYFSENAVVFADVSLDPAPAQQTGGLPFFGDDWPAGPGREVTGALCGSCHSLAIVKQQGLSRSDWDEVLDWMVEEHGMVQLETTIRTNILDYLSGHFGITCN